MASTKSARWVRLVVPTSRSRHPARAMMSGSRNEPPISISSPRQHAVDGRDRCEREAGPDPAILGPQRAAAARALAGGAAVAVIAHRDGIALEVAADELAQPHARLAGHVQRQAEHLVEVAVVD